MLRHIASQTSEGALAALGEAWMQLVCWVLSVKGRGLLGLVRGGSGRHTIQLEEGVTCLSVNGDIMTGQTRKTS